MATRLEYLIYSLFRVQKEAYLESNRQTFLAESLKLFHSATGDAAQGPVSL